MLRQQCESAGYRINQAVSDIDTAGSRCNVIPDIVEIELALRRSDMRHSARDRVLGSQPRTSPLLNVFRQRENRLWRQDAALASQKRGFGFIDGRENLQSAALALFPQGKSFPDRVLFMPQAPAFNGLTCKGLLIGSELYFHNGNFRIA